MISSFECLGKTYTLKVPLQLKVYKEGSYYFAENEFLDLMGCAKTEAGAIQDAREDLGITYSYKFKDEDLADDLHEWLLKVEMLLDD